MINFLCKPSLSACHWRKTNVTPQLVHCGHMCVVQRCMIALAMIVSANSAHAKDDYTEPFRPQFHFTPARNWMNDPNGMVYFEGEWHLFYQYNPHGNTWGHMSWGHAVSRDLTHWKHLPLALAEEDGIMIFSGSAVVDWRNTSGFGTGEKPPLVAIYTGHREGRQDQRLAYSNDKGRTWTKFAGNPVLDVKMADFRDPKVFWHEATNRWVMTVALAAEKKVHFYSSSDLKSWKYVGEFGPAGSVDGLWECPDLFPLKLDDGESKWVLVVNINPGGPAGGSGCQYFIGTFDGSRFITDAASPSRAAFVPEGKVLADFENGYADWIAEGDAFGAQPAEGTLPNQQPVTGFRGKRLANSFVKGDQSQGTLTSPQFEITASYMSFLIGGGAHPGTRIDLRVDGKVVRTAKGREREQLAWQSWNLEEFRGKQATIHIVDHHTGGWGHINVDQIIMANAPARASDETPLWADYGPDFYAAVSWSDVPKSDGRRIWLGWMSNWQYANEVPTTPWRSTMSVPRELHLRATSDGTSLMQRPVQEMTQLRGRHHHYDGGTLKDVNAWLSDHKIKSGPLEMEVELAVPATQRATIQLFKGVDQQTTIGFDGAENCVFVDRTKSGAVNFHPKFPARLTAPVKTRDSRIKLHLFVDDSSVEVFVNDGEQVLTTLIFPSRDQDKIELSGAESATVRSLDVWSLKSSWQDEIE